MRAKVAQPPVAMRSEPVDVERAHEAHAGFVWKTLHRMGVPEADLPDLLQEVFITVHRRRDSFDGTCSLQTWLYAICRGLVANHRRKLKRRREQVMGTPPEPVDGPTGDPEAPVMARRARERVRGILDGLDPDRRAVFVMFEVEGMACPAIAAALGVPLGTVYSRLRAAREDFKRAAARLQAKEGA